MGGKNPLKYGCESFELFIQTVIVKRSSTLHKVFFLMQYKNVFFSFSWDAYIIKAQTHSLKDTAKAKALNGNAVLMHALTLGYL